MKSMLVIMLSLLFINSTWAGERHGKEWIGMDNAKANAILKGLERLILRQSFTDCKVNLTEDGLRFQSLTDPRLGFSGVRLAQTQKWTEGNELYDRKLYKNTKTNEYRYEVINEFYFEEFGRTSFAIVFTVDPTNMFVKNLSFHVLPFIDLVETGDLFGERYEERERTTPGLETLNFECSVSGN